MEMETQDITLPIAIMKNKVYLSSMIQEFLLRNSSSMEAQDPFFLSIRNGIILPTEFKDEKLVSNILSKKKT